MANTRSTLLLIANIAMVVGLIPVGFAVAIWAMMLPGHYLSHAPFGEVVRGSLRFFGMTVPWGALAAAGWILRKFATRTPASDVPPAPTPLIPILVAVGAIAFGIYGFSGVRDVWLKQSEGAAIGRLAVLRTAERDYFIAHDGKHPRNLSDLVPKHAREIPPALWHSPYHARTNVVSTTTWIALHSNKLSDTGGWAYVNDPADPEWGTVAIDCTHPRANGRSWRTVDNIDGTVPTLRSMSAEDRNNPTVLLKALSNEVPEFRWMVILEIAKLGEKGKVAVPALIGCLTSHASGRDYAIVALNAIGPSTAAVPGLIDIMRDTRASTSARVGAAQALGRLGPDSSVVGALASALTDQNEFLRERAARSLKSIGTPEALAVLQKSEPGKGL